MSDTCYFSRPSEKYSESTKLKGLWFDQPSEERSGRKHKTNLSDKMKIEQKSAAKTGHFMKNPERIFPNLGAIVSVLFQDIHYGGSFYFYTKQFRFHSSHRHSLATRQLRRNLDAQKFIENFIFAKSLNSCFETPHPTWNGQTLGLARIMLQIEELKHWLSSKHSESFMISQEKTICLRFRRDQRRIKFLWTDRDMFVRGLRSW